MTRRKVPLTLTDHLLNGVSLLGLVLAWFYTVYYYFKLPDFVPTHFDSLEDADQYGSKLSIFFLPCILTAVVMLLQILSRFPHRFNYLVNITPANAPRQYAIAVRMLRIIQCNICLLFCYIIYEEIEGAKTGSSSLSTWFIPVLIFSVIVPTVYTIYKSVKLAKEPLTKTESSR